MDQAPMKRAAKALPTSEGARMVKKPRADPCRQECDAKVPSVSPAASSDKRSDGSRARLAKVATPFSSPNAAVAARCPIALACSASKVAACPGNESARMTAEHEGQEGVASSSLPASYQKYQPWNNYSNVHMLDYHFFYLNDMLFHKAKRVALNLFQAGRKQNFGFLDNHFTAVYLPARPKSLANWLECLNQGASVKPAGVEREGYAHYTWHSVVCLPRSGLTPQLTKKYKAHEKPGFTDAPVVDDHAAYPSPVPVDLDRLFPKVAALAGLRKDARVPKGWLRFSREEEEGEGAGSSWRLDICRGNARSGTRAGGRPRGLAFEGADQHAPVEPPLFRISGGTDIRGLHDLFCVVEGLLTTL